MAQEFKKGMVLVDGHGNFGSIEGDGAAAMRYTEARLTKFTQEAYLADLDKDIIDFGPNFDETEKEPDVYKRQDYKFKRAGFREKSKGNCDHIQPDYGKCSGAFRGSG